VREITHDTDDQAIVSAIIHMARSLGIGIIAEGVESTEQREILQGYGCNTMQGYLFSAPLEVDDFQQFVRQYRQRQQPAGPARSGHKPASGQTTPEQPGTNLDPSGTQHYGY